RGGHMMGRAPRRGRWLMVGLVLVLSVTACIDNSTDQNATNGNIDEDPGDCVVVDMAVSSEKIELLTDLAKQFNGSDGAKVGDECVFVRVQKKASGAAELLLEQGWDEATNGPQPVVWSPASSAWAAVLNQRLDDKGDAAMAN